MEHKQIHYHLDSWYKGVPERR